jgi:hypothetical protein
MIRRWWRAFAVHKPSLQTASLVDDALEQPGNRVWSERPFRRDAAYVSQHLLLALRLIDLDAELFFQQSDLARHAGALVQEPDQHFVYAVDIVP